MSKELKRLANDFSLIRKKAYLLFLLPREVMWKALNKQGVHNAYHDTCEDKR